MQQTRKRKKTAFNFLYFPYSLLFLFITLIFCKEKKMVCGNNQKTLSVTKDHRKKTNENLDGQIIESKFFLNNPCLNTEMMCYMFKTL